jgi:hypothetical protein
MVWAMMKKRLAKREPRTKDQLQAYIRQFWSMDMTVELCNQFIDHIFKVLPIALERVVLNYETKSKRNERNETK